MIENIFLTSLLFFFLGAVCVMLMPEGREAKRKLPGWILILTVSLVFFGLAGMFISILMWIWS